MIERCEGVGQRTPAGAISGRCKSCGRVVPAENDALVDHSAERPDRSDVNIVVLRARTIRHLEEIDTAREVIVASLAVLDEVESLRAENELLRSKVDRARAALD